MATEPRIQSTLDLLKRYFGVTNIDYNIDDTTDADATDKVLLNGNAGRLAFTVVNLGSDFVVLRPNKPATTTLGIRLNANGGAVSFTAIEDFLMPVFEWHIIGNIANLSLITVEFRLV